MWQSFAVWLHQVNSKHIQTLLSSMLINIEKHAVTLHNSFLYLKKKLKEGKKNRIGHLPELSVLMSIVHDKPTEERKSNALRSTNLRDSDQH